MAMSTASFCISWNMSALLMMTRLPVAVVTAGEGLRSSELGFDDRAPGTLLLASSLILCYFSSALCFAFKSERKSDCVWFRFGNKSEVCLQKQDETCSFLQREEEEHPPHPPFLCSLSLSASL